MNILKKIILFKIILFEKQNRTYEENEVYGAVWIVLLQFVAYTLALGGFIITGIYPSLKSYNVVIGITMFIISSGFIRLCIIRPIKQNKLVPSIYAEYQNMNQEEKKRYYRKGLIVVASFILYPFLLLAIMTVM